MTHVELCLWALAAHHARRHFERLVLVTDTPGARLLVDSLGLPADEVRLALDGFAAGLSHAWALGKVRAYADLPEPFCHVDGDFLLLDPLPERLQTAGVFAQHSEAFDDPPSAWWRRCYPLDALRAGLPFPPSAVAEMVASGRHRPVNMGLFGGLDLDFIHRYAAGVLAAAADPRNAAPLSRMDGTVASVFLEQYALGAAAWADRLPVEMLWGGGAEPVRGWAHLIGNSKTNPRYAQRILTRAAREVPEAFARAWTLTHA